MATTRTTVIIPSSPASSPASTPATPTPTPTPSPTTGNGATSTPTPSASAASSGSAASSASSASSASLTSSPTTAQIVTSSGDTLQTITSVVTPTVATTPTSSTGTTSSNSFFSNKGAVAGVFTVVGLVVVGLAIALIINAVRRRRARKFDRDVAEAAAEAAASSRSPLDEYPYGNAGGSGGGYGYSDNSHGTYQLPLLHPPNDSYGMSEMSQYDPYAATPGPPAITAAAAVGRSRSRKDSEPGTSGIAGVGAGTLNREPSKRAPYHAFAGPGPGGPMPHELQGSNGTMRGRRQDVLEAAGLAGAFVARKPSEGTPNTHGSGRGGSVSNHGPYPAALQPGYGVESYYPQRHENRSPDPFAGYASAAAASLSKPLPSPYEAATSLPSSPPPPHSEPNQELNPPSVPHPDAQRMSYQDDADYSQGHRVLRVANE